MRRVLTVSFVWGSLGASCGNYIFTAATSDAVSVESLGLSNSFATPLPPPCTRTCCVLPPPCPFLQEMLNFAAAKGIKPMLEMYKLSNINEAFERLASGKARYRVVMETDI